jgi:hypothetical protein
MGITKSRIEYINSANRTAGTNEDFFYQLSPWSNDDQYQFCCVMYANIPITYYLVTSGQNTFQLKEGVTAVTITVPPGNYNTNSLAKVIATLLNTNSPNAWTYSFSLPNSVSSAQTGLYTYTVSGNSSQPYFIFGSYLYTVLGFNTNTTYQFSGNSLTSVNVVNLTPETTLYLYSDIVETKDNHAENILQEFYSSNTSPFSNIVYQCTEFEPYSKKMNKTKTNYIHFTLLNEFYNPISLNGQPFFITLLLYKRDNIVDLVRRYIKLKLGI